MASINSWHREGIDMSDVRVCAESRLVLKLKLNNFLSHGHEHGSVTDKPESYFLSFTYIFIYLFISLTACHCDEIDQIFLQVHITNVYIQ